LKRPQKKLQDLLVGKTVLSIETSLRDEAYWYITTSDGKSFHICGTDMGSWIAHGPNISYTDESSGVLAGLDSDDAVEAFKLLLTMAPLPKGAK
jgi:hypothetical protein